MILLDEGWQTMPVGEQCKPVSFCSWWKFLVQTELTVNWCCLSSSPHPLYINLDFWHRIIVSNKIQVCQNKICVRQHRWMCQLCCDFQIQNVFGHFVKMVHIAYMFGVTFLILPFWSTSFVKICILHIRLRFFKVVSNVMRDCHSRILYPYLWLWLECESAVVLDRLKNHSNIIQH